METDFPVLQTDDLAQRFDVRARLGAGGFGDVYEVYDRERDAVVALKSLHQSDPRALYRFKQEFRSLADLTQRNLIQLYELISDGSRWLFTMELIDGTDFLSWVRGAGASAAHFQTPSLLSDHLEEISTGDTLEMHRVPQTGPVSLLPQKPPVDEARLRDGLVQLAHGILAIHTAGKLHRDIKPHNVLVTSRGRVVLLDFGMVTELAPERPGAADGDRTFVGTPHYMAPEQAMGEEATSASDWYSVGVMLFEILTGRFPVDGDTLITILLKKQMQDPPAPEDFPEGTPEDLIDLCRALLRRDPAERPQAHEVLHRLGEHSEATREAVPQVRASVSGDTPPFVGRHDHLRVLANALFDVQRNGRPGVVNVHGNSGMGKTALVREFLASVREERQALVLRGRCYENESLPYKALDSLVDRLTEYLQWLSDEEATECLGGDVGALVRVFPVLEQVPALRAQARSNLLERDVQKLRARAFAALKSLLRNLSRRRPLVLFIDDVQWGDADSAQLLAALLRPPDAPSMLLVTTYRDQDAEHSPFLATFLEAQEQFEEGIDRYVLSVGELSAGESRDLALALLEERGAPIERDLELIAREAQGSPFFIDELARYRNARRRQISDIHSLDDVIMHRLGQLAEPAQRLLEMLAVAGQPVDRQLARQAARIASDEQGIVAMLKNERLIRVKSWPDGDSLETYHDRIRETIRDRLPDEQRRQCHLRLARVYEEAPTYEPEILAAHYRDGGEEELAAGHALAAARQARAGLAFERAARAYRESLRLREWDGEARREILVELADVESSLARGARAAETYIEAAGLSSTRDAIELRRRAAEQLLRSGQIERGSATLYDVMRELELPVPPTGARLMVDLVVRQIGATRRGHDFEISEEPLPELERMRIDTCWLAANLMATIDVKLGAYFQLLNLRASLDSGDAERIVRTLGLQAVHAAARRSTRAQAEELLETAAELAKAHLPTPSYTESWLAFARGLAHYMSCDFRQAHRCFEQTERKLEASQLSYVWEHEMVKVYDFFNLLVLGRFRRYAERVPEMLEAARARDDQLQSSAVEIWGYLPHLVRDEPQIAREQVERAVGAWTTGAYCLQHFWYLQAITHIDLYTRDAEQALARVRGAWKEMKRGFILHSQLGRIIALELRARCALAVAAGDPSPGRHVRAALRDAKRLRREKLAWTDALALLVEAQAAALAGEDGEYQQHLAQAEGEFSKLDMPFHVAVIRYRLGQALGEARGSGLRTRAEDWMREQGVRNCAALVDMLCPVKSG